MDRKISTCQYFQLEDCLKNKFLQVLSQIFFFFLIFGCVASSLLCMGFLQLQRVGATLRCSTQASHCGGFSCCGAQAQGTWAPVVVARGFSSCGSRALERRLSSCGTWPQLLRSMWDLPGPGLEPVSPALAGGFLTTVPPGKSPKSDHFKFRKQTYVKKQFMKRNANQNDRKNNFNMREDITWALRQIHFLN